MVRRVGFAEGCSLPTLRCASAKRECDLPKMQEGDQVRPRSVSPLWRGLAAEANTLEAHW
jgi:hypothetical protein